MSAPTGGYIICARTPFVQRTVLQRTGPYRTSPPGNRTIGSMTTGGARRDLEIVVIGTGPAGSTAARLLAQRGARVRLLDARRLPRHKLCGGGLTPKADRWIPAAASACIERRASLFDLTGGRLGSRRLNLPDVTIGLVERAPFDLALAQAAVAAGADLVDGEPIVDVEQGDDARRPAVLTRSGGRIEADVIVAADGEPSRIAARTGLGGAARRRALALEVDLPLDPRRTPAALELRFGIPRGYAWYFPKGDHANVGVLTTDARRYGGLRAELRRYAREIGLDADAGRIRGHWIPMSLRRGPLAGGRILLAGDAAGTADPFFGEGISYALASGALAADAIGRWAGGRGRALEEYDARTRAAFAPAFSRLTLVAAIADTLPSLSIVALAALPWARSEARRGLLGLGRPFAFPQLPT
jgi:geranylgeranyl reductase family protein